MPNCLKYIFILLLILFLSGCGFHFRQYQDFPIQLRIINITSKDTHSPLKPLLIQNFQGMGMVITPDAPVVLDIISENFSQAASVIGTAQQVNSVSLNYIVSYQLENKSHHPIGASTTLSVNTAYLQNASQILGDTTATPSLQQELMRSMVQQILFHLSSANTCAVLNKGIY